MIHIANMFSSTIVSVTTAALKYKSSYTKEKTIFLLVTGLVLTIVVIVGAILFIPGEYSTKNACGLGLIVIPTAILILLQYYVFMITMGMSFFTIAILILQVLGHVLSVVGFSLCVSECTPVHGPLLISGLGIIALAELLGLVYMKCVVTICLGLENDTAAAVAPYEYLRTVHDLQYPYSVMLY
ncbi:hypothetical protein J1605_000338 [Eschrichtius robustus]|uniref:CD47-like transmembrane domain-containing protein n=1 Tax=Eschrichtius robustus TaxID=9764 RepID=A0AB34HMB3_ESCRO|nr:hypothetical protein J1605_000338 [Eschrichtius robustus]